MKIRHKAITASERVERDTMLQRAINIQNRHWKDGAKPDTRSEEYKQFKKDCDRRGVDAESIWNEAYNVRKDLRTAEASTVKCGTGMKITKRRVVANKKSVKAATSGKIPYDLVSMLVILRDWVDTDSAYLNKEHEDLVSIADSLYNGGRDMIEYMSPEYKSVYDKYGKKYFDEVLDDAAAIDSQINSGNLNDLIADYTDRANAFDSGVNASCSKKSIKASKVDGDDMTLTFITPDLSAATMVAEKAWEIGGFGSTWSEHSWVYIDVPATQSIDNIEDLIDYAQNNGVYLNLKSSNELHKWLGLVDAACGKKSVKAGYAPGEILWVLDEDNTWKTWGSVGPKIKSMSDAELLESLNSQGNNYIDVLITKNGENPDDYDRTEAIKDPFVKASAKKSVKCGEGRERYSVDTKIIDILEANGFESASGYSSGKFVFDPDQPYWDKWMWLGFGCTYNADTQEAYVWWNPDGNLHELPFNYDIKSTADAEALCDDLYNWDEYNIDELLNAGLPLIGATSHNNKLDEWDYDNGMGDIAYINTDLGSGYVIDAYGDKTEYNNLQDLLEAASIIR